MSQSPNQNIRNTNGLAEFRQACHQNIKKFLDSHNIHYHYYPDKKSAFRVNLPNEKSVYIQIDWDEGTTRPIYLYFNDYTVIRVPPGVSLEKKKFVKWGLISAEKVKLWCVTETEADIFATTGIYDSFEKAIAGAQKSMSQISFAGEDAKWIETSKGHWKYDIYHVDINEFYMNEDV